jgi:hypothetical protein
VIIGDLEASYLTRSRTSHRKTSRRKTYTVNPDQPFRHPGEAGHDAQDLNTPFHRSRRSAPVPRSRPSSRDRRKGIPQ